MRRRGGGGVTNGGRGKHAAVEAMEAVAAALPSVSAAGSKVLFESTMLGQRSWKARIYRTKVEPDERLHVELLRTRVVLGRILKWWRKVYVRSVR